MDELIGSKAQEVDAEIIEDEMIISSASFEIDMSGIQRDVEDLTFAIDQALTVYGDVLVEESAIADMERGEARRCELALSRAIRTADELRRQLNRDYKVPLDVAKRRYDELMGPVIALHEAYKKRRLEFEEADKAFKLHSIRTAYERIAPRISLPAVEGGAAPIPFERLLEMRGAKWLNKSIGMDSIEREIAQLAATVDEGEQLLEEAKPRHATETRAVFWQTLDVEKALSRDQELCALEARQAALETRAEQALGEGSTAGQTVEGIAAGQLADAPSQSTTEQAVASISVSETSSAPVADRKPRVMLIEGATDDECRQIAALCTSLGIRGVFKGPQFYEMVKAWTTR